MLIIPLDHEFLVQQVSALCNWDSFLVCFFLIFEVVKLCKYWTDFNGWLRASDNHSSLKLRGLASCNFVYFAFATKLANLEERIITWHKTRLSAFPIRVFKISAEKVQKHERTIINAYRIKFELFGVWGHLQAMLTRFLAFFDHLLPYLCWHFLPYNCWQKVNIFGLPTHLFLST